VLLFAFLPDPPYNGSNGLRVEGGGREMASLPLEVERILEEDAQECARRTARYKFGRLSTTRIVSLLRKTADEAGLSLDQDDPALVEIWFAKYDEHVKVVRAGREEPRSR
jgi:hypothetical protein